MYILLTTFRLYLNRHTKLSNKLNANSYNVYIIHTVIIGGIAFLLLDVEFPSIIKFLILTGAVYALSNVLVSLYRTVRKKLLLKK